MENHLTLEAQPLEGYIHSDLLYNAIRLNSSQLSVAMRKTIGEQDDREILPDIQIQSDSSCFRAIGQVALLDFGISSSDLSSPFKDPAMSIAVTEKAGYLIRDIRNFGEYTGSDFSNKISEIENLALEIMHIADAR